MKNFNKALDLFLSGQVGSTKRDASSVYVATKNALVVRRYLDGRAGSTAETVLVAKIKGKFFGNSSRLDLAERGSAVTPEQEALSGRVTMVPFNTIKEAGLSLGTLVELDKGPEETVWLNEKHSSLSESKLESMKQDKNRFRNIEAKPYVSWDKKTYYDTTYQTSRHFMGASLFTCENLETKVRASFLLDIDRVEIANGIFNPFVVQLKSDSQAKTIAQAYHELKPTAVLEAEAQGLTVKRQGEWFFIPVNNKQESKVETAFVTRTKGNTFAQIQGSLRVGNNRPNIAQSFQELEGLNYVSGRISHTGREHKDLELKTWHIAVPNTASTSWQISGDID